MNPRLVEPGFAVVCLHADVPARPGKDEYGEDHAQVARQHWKRQDTCTPSAFARAAGASMSPSRDRYSRRAPAQYSFNRSVWVGRAAIPIRDRRLSM
jgi:hypothetical protein